jgi:hypothetical protein
MLTGRGTTPTSSPCPQPSSTGSTTTATTTLSRFTGGVDRPRSSSRWMLRPVTSSSHQLAPTTGQTCELGCCSTVPNSRPGFRREYGSRISLRPVCTTPLSSGGPARNPAPDSGPSTSPWRAIKRCTHELTVPGSSRSTRSRCRSEKAGEGKAHFRTNCPRAYGRDAAANPPRPVCLKRECYSSDTTGRVGG